MKELGLTAKIADKGGREKYIYIIMQNIDIDTSIY
jgi:hypothetical protein